MTERHTYQPGVPCWVDTVQPDPQAAADFYGDLFGWEFTRSGPMPGDPPGYYFVARVRGRDVAGVGSPPQGAPPMPVWSTYIRVESADDAARKARSAGGGVVRQPLDVSPAGRLALVSDPQGAAFALWEPQQREGAQLVNEPGAWAMSILTTHDPEAAKSFYGAVFGWETDTFGTGEGRSRCGDYPVTSGVSPNNRYLGTWLR